MPLTQEQLNKVIVKSREAGIPEELIQRFTARDLALSKQEAVKPSGLAGALPIVGGIAGAALGTALGPWGTIGGGAAGSALGEALRQGLTREADTGRIATEAALGAAGGVAGRALGTAGRVIRGVSGVVGGKAPGFLANRAASAVLKASPQAYKNAIDVGLDLNQTFVELAPKLGNTFEEMLGPIGVRRKGVITGGNIRKIIKSAEDIITNTARVAGKDFRFPNTEILKSLNREYAVLGRGLDQTTRMEALSRIMQEIRTKWAKGFTVSQARTILRDANQRFGKSIMETEGDAVRTASEKLRADTLKGLLRKAFPTISDALDTEQKAIVVREALEKARADAMKGGFRLGRFSILSPGALIDALMERPEVGGRLVAALSPRLTNTPMLAAMVKGTQLNREQTARTVNSIARNLTFRGLEQFGIREIGGVPSNIGEVTSPEVVSEDKQWQWKEGGWAPSAQTTIPRQKFIAAMMYDFAATGGKNLPRLKAMYDFMNPQGSVAESAIDKISAIQAAEGLLDEVDGVVRKIGLKKFGPVARISGPLRTAWANAGLDPILYSYLGFRQSMASRISRALGEVGNLREEDIQRAMVLLPMPNDSLPEAMLKLNQLRGVISRSKQALEDTISRYKGFQISGVPATPAEVSF